MMSYTKKMNDGIVTMFKANCPKCKNENELILCFDNSDFEYTSMILCKKCIINLIDTYSESKHNEKCVDCEEYSTELISRDIPGSLFPGKYLFCRNCVKRY